MNEKLQKISKNLKNQDNRITADPIFYVQEEKTIWGIDSDYDPEWTWIDSEEGQEVDEDAWPHLEIIEEDWIGEKEEVEKAKKILDSDFGLCFDTCKKVGYIKFYVNVQPFFTEKAAQDYIDYNRHRLENPRIYVASAYRNDEWNDVRKFLMDYEL